MRATDIISNAFISNTTGGMILGGSLSSLLSLSALIGASLGLALGLYAFYSVKKCAEKEDVSVDGSPT